MLEQKIEELSAAKVKQVSWSATASFQRVVCTDFNGVEDVSLLERCPHFGGWYVQASMELGPEDVSLLERCPHFRGWYMYTQALPILNSCLSLYRSSLSLYASTSAG